VSSRTQPLRILIVTPRYPPDVGGVERHVFEVAPRLAEAGCQVTVLCTDRTGRMSAYDERDGVTVRRVRAWPVKRDYYFAPGIYREIARGSWDLVHVQSYHTFVAPMAMFAALRFGIPYVVTFHGGGHSSRVRNALRRTQRRLLRPLLARAQRLVATARFEIELYSRELDLTPQRFVLIPSGVEVESPHAPLTHDSVDGALIASVGRLERYKGHQRVIAALPHVLDHRPDARLWIAGGGPEDQALRRQAERLGVADRVVIEAAPIEAAGEDEPILERLRGVALVVLLSDFETHPNAALEALALGRPLLVADNSGLRELAERGLARAVSADSSPELVADAIVEQLQRPLVPADLQLSSWDECAASLMDLYETATIGRTPCAS
jgi:glycosyltransferase involved in cell wall biosynthesis